MGGRPRRVLATMALSRCPHASIFRDPARPLPPALLLSMAPSPLQLLKFSIKYGSSNYTPSQIGQMLRILHTLPTLIYRSRVPIGRCELLVLHLPVGVSFGAGVVRRASCSSRSRATLALALAVRPSQTQEPTHHLPGSSPVASLCFRSSPDRRRLRRPPGEKSKLLSASRRPPVYPVRFLLARWHLRWWCRHHRRIIMQGEV